VETTIQLSQWIKRIRVCRQFIPVESVIGIDVTHRTIKKRAVQLYDEISGVVLVSVLVSCVSCWMVMRLVRDSDDYR